MSDKIDPKNAQNNYDASIQTLKMVRREVEKQITNNKSPFGEQLYATGWVGACYKIMGIIDEMIGEDI